MPKLNETYVSEYSDNKLAVTSFHAHNADYITFMATQAKTIEQEVRVTLKNETAAKLARSILDYCTEELLKGD